MKKIRCALIGPGNIGTDLLYKLKRSPVLEPVWMVGIDPTSEGLARAAEMGLKTTAEGVDGLLPHVETDGIQIAFDATSAYLFGEHLSVADILLTSCLDWAVGYDIALPTPTLAYRARVNARPAYREARLRNDPAIHPAECAGVVTRSV